MDVEIRQLVVEAFAGLGVTVTENAAGDLVGPDGSVYQLQNVIHRAGQVSGPQRRHVVFEHVAALIDIADVPAPDRLSDSEFQQRLRARVFATEYAAGVPGYTYMAPVDAGDRPALKRALCLDWPDHVQIVGDDDLIGRDIADLWATGIAATCAEPSEHRTLRQDGAEITIMTGDSWFTSSRILDMPALCEQTGGPCDHGMIVAVPTAATLLMHRPRNSACTAASIRGMSVIAGQFADQAEGHISRNLFYWDGGEHFEAMTRPDRGGTSPAFRRLLARLP